MAERKRITLVYIYSENWIGGAYYILNIIKALNYLEDNLKPHLTIVRAPQTPEDLIRAVNYPYIDIVVVDFKLSLLKKAINKITFDLFKKRFFKIQLSGNNLYPVDERFNIKKGNNYYYWIPDLQDKYLPEMFDDNDLKSRENFWKHIVKYNRNVIFSSKTAMDDFDKFYPENNCKKKVVKFVSIQTDDYKNINMTLLKEKFNITSPYFVVSNQFWKHKNHEVVLKAVKLLKERNEFVQILFTGKEHDHRNPQYVPDLKNWITANSLEHMISFLGFIDRNEQLQLIANSIAVIQPSLFEGWSTVVEDCKTLNKYILVSDIPVHREQIKTNCSFFSPHDPNQLSKFIQDLKNNVPPIRQFSNEDDIIEFAKIFISAFD